jgi:hypothetical protein
MSVRQAGTILVSLIAYGVVALAITALVVGVYLSIKKRGYAEAEAKYKPQLEAVTKDRDDTRKKYDDFARRVEAEGKAQAARAAEIDAENTRREKERKTDYDKRIAALVADNQRLVGRVRDHFARAGTSGGAVPVPEVPGAACAPRRGPADALLVEGLARDCAVTTQMFLECRDAWRGVAR